MIGLDTSAIIDIFRGNEGLRTLISGLDEPLAATRMTYLELMFGLDMENPKHVAEEKYYNDFFSTISVLELDSPACRAASKIHFGLRKKGTTIGGFDCAIAGTLQANGVQKIITKNSTHFGRIPGMRVIKY